MANRYQIEIRGRASERILRPVTDEFTVDITSTSDTRLTGEIRDPSHLHGLLAHFTSMNAEVVGVHLLDDTTDTAAEQRVESGRHIHQQRNIQQQKGITP